MEARKRCRREMTRRDFIVAFGGLTAASSLLGACSERGEEMSTGQPTRMPSATPGKIATQPADQVPTPTMEPTEGTRITLGQVALVKAEDRAEGVRKAVDLLGVNPLKDKRVLLKPNFNSADPAPGSTHPDVLRTMVEEIQGMGASSLTVADRSGMGDTRRVMESVGVFDLAEEFGFDVIVFDELGGEDWSLVQPDGSHWKRGFPIARVCVDSEAVVQTCCLKTHRFGGHFTLSLKNSVGLVAKTVPGDTYDYMQELHASPHQRRMIAEINTAYAPALVVMDAVEAFVSGGPDRGERVHPGVVLAGTDRVAMDAVGVAILRSFGTTPEVSRGPVFEQEQIARAAALGLGVGNPDEVEFLVDDPQSEAFAASVREILLSG